MAAGEKGLARLLLCSIACTLAVLAADAALGARYFRINTVEIVDVGGTPQRQPLACVTVRTNHHVALVSDRNGAIAFYEPGLMGQQVFFTPARAGFQHAADGFGYRGRALQVVEEGEGTLELTRVAGEEPGPCSAGDEQTRLLAGPVPTAAQHLRLAFIDQATGRGVPLAQLSAGGALFVSDSHGLIALHDPDAMGTERSFSFFSHGYALADGASELSLTLTPGSSATVELARANIAQRLYRVTGGGIYRDSALLDEPAPVAAPLLSGKVLGQDSVLTELYRGQVFWIWGDTGWPAYPLGNFDAAGATSLLPGQGGLDPEVGVDLRYFVDPATGFARPMAPQAEPRAGATWLDALVSVPDAAGQQRLLAVYGIFPGLEPPVEAGMVRFDDATEVFDKVLQFDGSERVRPEGHPVKVAHVDGDFVYFPLHTRIAATAEALLDPAGYQAFTPLVPGRPGEVERDDGGVPQYRWRRGADPVTQAQLDDGTLRSDQVLFGQQRDLASGEALQVHRRSVAYNPYRRRYTAITLQAFGATSLVGEVWYAEADTPMGPWVYAVHVLGHRDYSFYNPRHHPFFDQAGGQVIFFEGTYSSFFTESAPTPRYDYNQVMYKLDLADPRLALPVPVYAPGSDGDSDQLATLGELRPGVGALAPAFFAMDRPGQGTLPVAYSGAACAPRRLLAGAPAPTPPVFHAVPASSAAPPPGVMPLWSFAHTDSGARAYSVDADWQRAGFEREAAPVALVWPSPTSIALPVGDHLPRLRADAGPDRCVDEAAPGAGATVALDGSASSSEEGAIVEYRWSWEGGSASGVMAEAALGAGLHVVTLRVALVDGRAASDTALVQVGPAEPVPVPDGGAHDGAQREGGGDGVDAARQDSSVNDRGGAPSSGACQGCALGAGEQRAMALVLAGLLLVALRRRALWR